jgi:hypothetical protein
MLWTSEQVVVYYTMDLYKFEVRTSDSIVEHRVLDTRRFDLIFEYSNFRVIDLSNRVSVLINLIKKY